MPIEPITKGTDIIFPEEQQVRERGFFESIGTGAAEGFQQTLWKTVPDVAAMDEARKGYGTPMTQQEYENDINYIPGMAYQPYMTRELLSRIADSYYSHQVFQSEWEKYSTSSKVGSFVGQFLGAVPDPTNLVPIPGLGALSWAKRAGYVGAANSAIEFATSPLTREAYKARGMEYTDEIMMTNMGFAFGAGFGLSALIDGTTAGILKAARTMGFNNKQPTLADQILARYDEGGQKITLDQTTIDLINTGRIKIDLSSIDNIMKKNVYNVDKTYLIDRTGKIQEQLTLPLTREGEKVFSDYAEVKLTANNEVQIRGDAKTIVKLSKELQNKEVQNIPEGATFRLFLPDGPEGGLELGNIYRFDDWADRQVKLYNRSTLAQNIKTAQLGEAAKNLIGRSKNEFAATLDPDWTFRSADGTYELRFDKDGVFDLETNKGSIYRIQDGKVTKIPDADVKRVYDEAFKNKLDPNNPSTQKPQESPAQTNAKKDPDQFELQFKTNSMKKGQVSAGSLKTKLTIVDGTAKASDVGMNATNLKLREIRDFAKQKSRQTDPNAPFTPEMEKQFLEDYNYFVNNRKKLGISEDLAQIKDQRKNEILNQQKQILKKQEIAKATKDTVDCQAKNKEVV